MNYSLFKPKDNAEGQLDSDIGAGTMLIPLQAGEGSEFPTTYTGAATSLGSSTVLNSTGIGATGVAIGDFIENLTDGSHAFILAVAANSVTTSELRGGADNTWQNNDEYAVNRFVVTLNQRDANGNITAYEKVLIASRSGDNLTVETRGYDGDSPQSFDTGDYVSLFVVSRHIIEIGKALAELYEDLETKATTSYVDAALANRNWKQSVRVATTAAGTLATSFENGDTIDGVVLATGDRILIKDQASPIANGIYTVNASGAPTRATDFDEDDEATSAMVAVQEGTSNADSVWLCTDEAPNIGVDNINFTQFGASTIVASQAEAEAGSNNTKMMTPLRTKQSIDKFVREIELTFGENIDGTATVPLAVHIADGTGGRTAGRVYKSDADDTTNAGGYFEGFVNTNVTGGNAGKVIIEGVVDGFVGLTVGRLYYLSTTSGEITLTNTGIPIGKAVSATQILIMKGMMKRLRVANQDATGLSNSNTTLTFNLPFRPRAVIISGAIRSQSGAAANVRILGFKVEYDGSGMQGHGTKTGSSSLTNYAQPYDVDTDDQILDDTTLSVLDGGGGSTTTLDTLTIAANSFSCRVVEAGGGSGAGHIGIIAIG